MIIDVIGQKLILNEKQTIVSKSQEFVEFEFNLSDEWKDLLVFAQFKQGEESYNIYLDDDNKCFLPSEIKDGSDGAKGDKGDKGETGDKGADGYSPTVSVSKTDGVTTVTITDKDGEKTAEVKDGESKGTDRWVDGTSIWYSVRTAGAASASGSYSTAEGHQTNATGASSHAEGRMTRAESTGSHAEGYSTTATGTASHTEGYATVASGYTSHAEGTGTIASGSYQHAQGKYNIADSENKYAHIVGGGTSDSNRKNIHTLDWSGNTYYSGAGSAYPVVKAYPYGTVITITETSNNWGKTSDGWVSLEWVDKI